MTERTVLRLMCDDAHEISFLFGAWGAVDGADAIRQIESGHHTYTLQRQDGSRAPLAVVDTGTSKRLRAFANGVEAPGLVGAVQIGG